jgi:ligand-binding sensor domain-containing protein
MTLSGCFGESSPEWAPPHREVYAASYIHGVFRSLDGGKNWLAVGADPRPVQAYRKSLALTPEGKIFVATSGGGLFSLSREDEPYVDIGHTLRSDNIRSLFFDPHAGVLWVGTWGSGMYATADQGASWTQMSEGLTAYRVSCLAGNPDRPSCLYCGTTAGLFVREKDGPWREVQGTSGMDVRSLLVLPAEDRIYVGLGWAGGPSCLMSSRDRGVTWERDDRGLPRSTVFCLAHDSSTGQILAGTASGVFARGMDDSSWSRRGRKLPEARVLAVAASEGYTYAATTRGLFGIAPGAGRWRELTGSLHPSAMTDVRIRMGSRPASQS